MGGSPPGLPSTNKNTFVYVGDCITEPGESVLAYVWEVKVNSASNPDYASFVHTTCSFHAAHVSSRNVQFPCNQLLLDKVHFNSCPFAKFTFNAQLDHPILVDLGSTSQVDHAFLVDLHQGLSSSLPPACTLDDTDSDAPLVRKDPPRSSLA